MGVQESSQPGDEVDRSQAIFSGLMSGVNSPMIPEVTGIQVDEGVAMDEADIVTTGVCWTGRLKLA